ncbi:MAG TPA: FG-GAP-like repeat-containing protein, partial [Gemmataceae bacterium]|nr:FG-GAP-like repeat-containing protein [Gemmataceae bacterium]
PVTFNTVETLAPTSTLTVTITDAQTSAVPGTPVVYTVVVSNAGPSAASGVTLGLPLSPALLNPTFTSTASGGASGNTASGTGSLNEVLNLPVGGSITYTITAQINPLALGSLTNTATLTAPPFSPDLAGAVHTATDTDTLTPIADVSVTTARLGKAPAPGGRLTYTITVTNTGPSAAQSVSFTNTMPAAGVFTAITQTGGPTFTLSNPGVGLSGPVSGTIGVLNAGQTATFTLTMKAFGPEGTAVNNSVAVSSPTTDPVTGNNSSSAATSITKILVPPRIVVGTGVGGGPNVRVFDAAFGDLLMSFNAYEDTFRGGVNVAQGDVTGDGIPDIIAGSGVGGGPAIKVFDGATGQLIRSFFAYEASFRGGVNVSTGDINGDGVPDIFAGSGVGGGPAVKVFDGATGQLIRSFFAYEDTFRGGVLVNAGDINGDGFADVIAGSGVGGGPAVKVFDGRTGALIRSFFAYADSLRGGVRVAAGDVNGDGFDDIIAGAGDGGAPNVRVFDGRTGGLTQSFFAFDSSVLSGANVGAVDADGDGRADILVSGGVGTPPTVKVFLGTTGDLFLQFDAFDSSFTGGVFVG